MRVWIEYGPLRKDDHRPDKHVDKTDRVMDDIAERHSAKHTGSGYDFTNYIRDREYKVPHSELAGFFTEVTDHWNKFKLHRVVVHAK